MMKKFLLLIVAIVSFGNINASDMLDKLLIDQKMKPLIISLHKIMAEIKKNNVRHLYSRVVSDYHMGNTRYRTTEHVYDSDAPWNNEINRYKQALDDIDQLHALSSIGDGAILGFVAALMAQCANSDTKTSGIGLALCSLLLTWLKHQNLDVAYLTYPKLEPNGNYFGGTAWLGTFMYIGLGSAVGYLGTTFLIDKIADKVEQLSEAND
jgi:hypothetical protein